MFCCQIMWFVIVLLKSSMNLVLIVFGQIVPLPSPPGLSSLKWLIKCCSPYKFCLSDGTKESGLQCYKLWVCENVSHQFIFSSLNRPKSGLFKRGENKRGLSKVRPRQWVSPTLYVSVRSRLYFITLILCSLCSHWQWNGSRSEVRVNDKVLALDTYNECVLVKFWLVKSFSRLLYGLVVYFSTRMDFRFDK